MIRRAVMDDLSSIFRISLNSFNNPWSEASYKVELQKDFSHTFVCILFDKMAGYITIWNFIDVVELVNLATDRAFRRQGIASSLLEYVFNKYPNAVRWNLEVEENNISALHLYEKHGFQKARYLKNYYGNSMNALQMTKIVTMN